MKVSQLGNVKSQIQAVIGKWDDNFIVELIPHQLHLLISGHIPRPCTHVACQDSYPQPTSNLSLPGPQLEGALHTNKNQEHN